MSFATLSEGRGGGYFLQADCIANKSEYCISATVTMARYSQIQLRNPMLRYERCLIVSNAE